VGVIAEAPELQASREEELRYLSGLSGEGEGEDE
jgi:hypothetical protein